ncbi:hypothetical protein MK280_07825, partial [Myxococcota bacterium]|nr:hypothetical protein [Myxococcota bacterium]
MNSSFRIVAAAAILLVSDGHPAAATERGTAGQLKAARVIMLVLDGVRWQDFFDLPRSRLRPNDGRPHPFEGYWKKLSEGGVAFGNQTRGSTARMTLSSFFRQRKSLPSYQAMLAGFAQPCPDNDCARIEVETLPEAIARRLSLPPDEVAVIASWHGLERAAAHEPGTIHINAGDKSTPRKSDGAPSTRSDDRTAEIALN